METYYFEENEDDEFHESKSTFDIFKLSKMTEKIEWIDYNASIFRTKKFASEIIDKLENWNFNRYLDEEHKNKIKISLINQRTPLLFGDIHIVMDNNYRCLVINGQHRIKAINEIILENKDYDILLDFLIFKLNNVDNITDDENKKTLEQIENIFNIVNMSYNSKSLRQKELFAMELAISLSKEYEFKKGIIVKTKSLNTRKPKISLKELKDKIYQYLPDNYEIINITSFVKKVKLKNKEFSMMDLNEIYIRMQPAKSKLNQYHKAIELNFFLNLDGICSPESWIPKCF